MACWFGYERRPVGRMNSCGRQIFWVGDGGLPDGRMNPFGSYGGDYSIREGKLRYITIRDRV